MTHRERVLAALNHQEVDRVPVDLGATRDSSIVKQEYLRLKEYLGINGNRPIRLLNRMMQVVEPEEEVLEYFDVDLRGVGPGPPEKGGDKELGENRYQDEWGVVRVKPPGSFYYDLVDSPLSGPLASSDIMNYGWPDPHDPGRIKGLREKVERLRGSTDYAIVLSLPSPFVHISQYIRGFEDWFIDSVANPRLLGMLCDAILDVTLAMCGDALKEVGELVDIVFCADDLGMQNGPIVSPEIYRRLFKMRHKRYLQFVHDHTSAKLAFHTCGSVWDLLDDLIEIGVEVLNPIQVAAAKMDTIQLKKRYGKHLSFWGAIDTQHILPHGAKEDVEREVKRRIGHLARGGGYILSAVHNIQPDVPPSNIVTMYEWARSCSASTKS